MMATKPAMKMPEFLVYARSVTIGVVGAEVWRIAFYLGSGFAPKLSGVAPSIRICGILVGTLVCVLYAAERGAHVVAMRVGRSLRIDLLVAFGIGIWADWLASAWSAKVHAAVKRADSDWAAAVFTLLFAVLLSALIRQYVSKPKGRAPQLYFVGDEEIRDEEEDLLTIDAQAKSFAGTVLASGAHQGLIFGIDGPWGTGKTSFMNLVERYWESAGDRVIVCRFEPLRYASESDLTDRLIRDLSAAIQQKVFAPEFRPAVSRYSRLIKGKADLSFLGFKLSLEPSQETVDELLDNIDEVLGRIGHRVIIVIDDLDRLDAKSTNNVLFATRRTFKLSQATYVLCYDTEILVGGKEEGSTARQFLEKFVTVKMSLFVDSSKIRDFLTRDWQSPDKQLGSIPSDTMVRLGEVLNQLAEILKGDLAARYLPLVGDLRKVKRFVNAMLLMQLDKSDLGRMDFNKSDLINLILLHLNYPGLFRRIYAEETEGRHGIFSVRREYDGSVFTFKNSSDFPTLLEGEQDETATFLLTQLFDVKTLELEHRTEVAEPDLASRACFNQPDFRNLEGFLKLIVRFVTPEPQTTYVLYQNAVERVRKGTPIASILTSPEFRLELGEHAHDQFWRVLVNLSHDFTRAVAEDAINTLVDYLPRYSAITHEDRGLRPRSIYSLLRLLDRAGWGRTEGRRLPNTAENIVEIAWRIFGERFYNGKGLLQRLVASERGVLGWNDLMLFRLQCSADRQGQLHDLHSALILDQDENAVTTGLVSRLALIGMRRLSQEVFALFKQDYIIRSRNFFSEVNDTPLESFLGGAPEGDEQLPLEGQSEHPRDSLARRVAVARVGVKSFVIYQLSNTFPPNGSGVGCGHYDECGAADARGIAKMMNEYVFDVCFNPDISDQNIFHFLDHCLSHLTNSFFSAEEEDGRLVSNAEIAGGLDPVAMGRYWRRHGEFICQLAIEEEERQVVTNNYTASYRQHLPGVFTVLQGMAEEATKVDARASDAT